MRSLLKAAVTGAAICALTVGSIASAQEAAPAFQYAWVVRPDKLPGWKAPNKPIWRLSEVLAAHKGATDWSQDVVHDDDYNARFVQMGPGGKTRQQMWADDRVLFVVESGQLRFNIQGQQPILATKGFMVEVPARVPYSMETVGDAPALRFEVTRGGAYPLYTATADDTDTPKGPAGMAYMKTTFSLPPDKYDDKNPPVLDFEKDVAPTSTPRVYFVSDKNNQFQLLRGPAVPVPPPSNLGHLHPGHSEFWLIMQGQVDFLMEGEKDLISAHDGDVVYAPPYRWHRATSGGTGMATRLSIVPRSPIILNYCETCQGK